MKKGESEASKAASVKRVGQTPTGSPPSAKGGPGLLTLLRRLTNAARSAIFRILPFLARVPRLAMLGIAAVLLASVTAREASTPPLAPGEATPRLLGWTWWTTPRQVYGERTLPAFDNTTIESLELVPLPATPGKAAGNRVWIAGDAGLLAYSDDNGTQWATFRYDAVRGTMVHDPMWIASLTPLITWRVEAAGVLPHAQQKSITFQQQANRTAQEKKNPAAQKKRQTPGRTITNLPLKDRNFLQLAPSKAMPTPPKEPPHWIAIEFADEQSARLIASPSYMLSTNDGGATWVPAALPDSQATIEWRRWLFIDGRDSGAPGSLIRLPYFQFPTGQRITVEARSPNFTPEWSAFLGTGKSGVPEFGGASHVGIQMASLYPKLPSFAWFVGSTQDWTALIFHTENQGINWRDQFHSRGYRLRDIVFREDGKNGFAAGTVGAILRTLDGGAHWQPITLGAAAPGKLSTDYRWWQRPVRIPAPLSLLGILLALIVLIPAVLPETVRIAVVEHSIANIAVSDAPVISADDDELGFTPVARAIAGLLRNKATGLPLTVAITAPWGRGKTSLMSLVQQELKSSGWRTVWFNAWHHQEDASGLASLLQTVRLKAPPELIARGGLRYRLRLLAGRLWRWRTLWVLAVVAGLYLGEATVHDHNPKMYANSAKYLYEVTGGTPAAKAAAGEKGGEKPGVLQVIARMLVDLTEHSQDTGAGHLLPLAVLGFFVALLTLQVMQSFGANPAELLARTSDRKTVKGLEAQTGFLEKFRKQYGDVVGALGKYRLAIFVDDLDRCRPDKIAEMLEAANYLMAAGPCALLMALEEHAVITGLGLSFSRMAEELGTLPENHKSAQGDLLGEAREKREAFARNYVEKLFNIVVKAPPTESSKFARLLAGTGRRAQLLKMPRDRWSRRLRRVTELARVPAAAIVLGALLLVGNNLLRAWLTPQPLPVTAEAPQQTTQNVAPTSARQPAKASSPQATQASSQGDASPSVAPKYAAAKKPLPGAWFETWWQRMLWGLLALSLGLSLSVRRPPPSVADTPEFEEALNIWAPVLGLVNASPRFAKRVLNRLRYLATLEREVGNEVDSRIPETVLVMLGVLDAVLPNFLDTFEGLGHFLRGEAATKLFGGDAKNIAVQAWTQHEGSFGPVSAERLDRYRHRFVELSASIVAR